MRFMIRLAILALFVCAAVGQARDARANEAQMGAADTSWFYTGSILYAPGARSGGVSFQPIFGQYVGLQASQFCAPRLTGVAASVYDQWRGTNILVPVRFISQRYWNGNVEAIYQVTTGYQTVLNGVAVNYYVGPFPSGSDCELRVYVGAY